MPAALFLDHFASDRSHMLPASNASDLASSANASETAYSQPPPVWSKIIGPQAVARGVNHNLWSKYLDMRFQDERHGSELSSSCWEDREDEGRIYGQVVGLTDFARPDQWWK